MSIQNLKPYNIEVKNTDSDCSFLENTLYKEINYFLEKDGYKNIDTSTWKLGYSLSYSQGDGVGLTEGKITIKDAMQILKITKKEIFKKYKTKLTLNDLEQVFAFDLTNSWRYPSINVELDYNDYSQDYDDECQALEGLVNPLEKYLESLMEKLEKFGYEYIQDKSQENLLQKIFQGFLETNNIESDLGFWEFDYTLEKTEAEQKQMTLISDLDCYNFGQGFWVKLPEPTEATRKTSYYI